MRVASATRVGPSSACAARVSTSHAVEASLPVTRAGFPKALNAYESLRHSTATEWLRRGASEREVQALLGHKTAHATPRYARLADGRLDTIVGKKNRE